MKIINIVDIHGNNHPIEKIRDELSSVDLVIIGGDLTHFGSGEQAAELIESLRISNPNILAVPGNCDTKGVDDYLDKQKINLHGRVKKIGGINFIGAGGSLPCPSPTPTVYSEDQYRDILASSLKGAKKSAPMVMVCHQPPFDTTNDTLANGEHVGSRTVRDFIKENKPLVCITGHIHEAAGIDEIEGTKIVNPGPLGTGSYAYLEVTDKIESLEIREF
jgi:uncharacterized protein